MKFGNMLFSFYKLPKEADLGNLFKVLHMVSCHAGYHRAWDCTYGSIQGWFPTLDTILHSMMVQFAFVDARRNGHFDSDARMNKLTLIDDVVALLMSVKGDVKLSVQAIINNYGRLGFAAEMSKTILRSAVFIFLNQLYCNGQEVITACKIFARIDRQRSTTLATVWTNFRTRRKVLRDIRAANRKALDHWKQVTVIQSDARAQNVSASTLAMDCSMNQQLVDGTQISDLSLTSP